MISLLGAVTAFLMFFALLDDVRYLREVSDPRIPKTLKPTENPVVEHYWANIR